MIVEPMIELYEITFVDGVTTQEYGESVEDVTAFCKAVYSADVMSIHLVSE